jgi:hypothetical protein
MLRGGGAASLISAHTGSDPVTESLEGGMRYSKILTSAFRSLNMKKLMA